jgi:peptidoglycan hydrolase CwlO-like protein
MEERSSSSRLENNLKHKLQTVENEINERQRLIDSLTEENASLRNNLSQNNANHNKEFEGLVMEKAALKSQMHELESQLSDQVRGNEDALRKIYELEQNSDKYEMELKYLQDKVRKLEGDKNDQKNHFDQRIIEVASHNNQLERKLYESQSEGELELRSALKREENLKEDLDRLKKQVDDLTTQRQDKDQELKDTKVDMKKKDADIATLREEIQNLIKENIKTKAVSDYSRSFVNDVTSVNEKLINTLLENTKQPLSSVAGSVSQFNFGDPKSRHDFTIKESSIAESEGSRSPKPKELSGKRLLNDSITTGTDTSPKDLDDYRSNSTSTLNPHNNYATFSGIPVTKSTYKTPDGKSFGSGEKNGQLKSGGGGGGGNSAKANRKSSVTWADDGSQQQDRLASPENLYYNNSRNSSVKTKDLFSNELLKNSIQSGGKNRENSETRRGRSPQTDFNERQQQQRKENSEDKFEYENLIKAIIDMEKEILTLNKEYQNVSNEVTGKEDNSKVKRHLGEITQKLQIKSEELIKLKKKEEGMMSKFNF